MAHSNPAKEALKQWRALPVKLPRAWYKVSPYARFLGIELFRHCDDAYQGVIDTTSAAEWMDDICRKLEVDGPNRPATKTALTALVSSNLIRVFEDHIFVDLGQKGARSDTCRTAEQAPSPAPAKKRVRITVRSRSDHGQNTVISPSDHVSTQTVENIKLIPPRIGEERIGEDKIVNCPTYQSKIASPLSVPVAIAYRWLCDTWYAGAGAPDIQHWRADYEKIGSWTPEFRTRVAAGMQASTWLKANRGRATPAHIVKCKESYASGKPDGATVKHSRYAGVGPTNDPSGYAEDKAAGTCF